MADLSQLSPWNSGISQQCVMISSKKSSKHPKKKIPKQSSTKIIKENDLQKSTQITKKTSANTKQTSKITNKNTSFSWVPDMI